MDIYLDGCLREMLKNPTVNNLTEVLAICFSRVVDKDGLLTMNLLGSDYEDHLYRVRQVASKLHLLMKEEKL